MRSATEAIDTWHACNAPAPVFNLTASLAPQKDMPRGFAISASRTMQARHSVRAIENLRRFAKRYGCGPRTMAVIDWGRAEVKAAHSRLPVVEMPEGLRAAVERAQLAGGNNG